MARVYVAPCATCPQLPPLVYLILIWFRYPRGIRRFLTKGEEVKFSFDLINYEKLPPFCGSTRVSIMWNRFIEYWMLCLFFFPSTFFSCCVFFVKYGQWVIIYISFFFFFTWISRWIFMTRGGYFEGIKDTVWYGDKVLRLLYEILFCFFFIWNIDFLKIFYFFMCIFFGGDEFLWQRILFERNLIGSYGWCIWIVFVFVQYNVFLLFKMFML